MKKVVIAVLAALTVSTPGLAADGWTFDKSVSPRDDSVSHELNLNSNETESGKLAILGFDCVEGKQFLRVSIMLGSARIFSNSVEVSWRADKDKAHDEDWRVGGGQYVATFNSPPILSAWGGKSHLWVRIKGVDNTFEIAGFEPKLQELRKRCGLNTELQSPYSMPPATR
jgi:hypothetical protein